MLQSEIEREVFYRRDNWGDVDSTINAFEVANNNVKIGDLDFSITEAAKGQLYSRLGMPNTPRDFTEDSEFLQQAVNRKISLTKEPSKFIVDKTKAIIKGVMSTDYTRLPDHAVYQHLVDKNYGNLDKRSFISDNIMRLNFDAKERHETTKKGDFIGFGYGVFNSETGHSSLGATMSILRLACLNGAVSRKELTTARIPHRVDRMLQKMDDNMLLTFKPQEFLDVLNHAISAKPILSAPDQLAEEVFKRYKIEVPQYHIGGIIPLFQQSDIVDGGGYNAYGVYNAITNYATHIVSDPIVSHDIIYKAYPVLKL